MQLLSAFKAFLAKNNLLPDSAPTLLAVSGGLDSTVLAHLFRAADLPFGLAHCNFQLRDEESEGDEIFVQQMAARYDVPFFTKRFDTTHYAEKRVCLFKWLPARCATAGWKTYEQNTVLVNLPRRTT